jgi:hypothetical protein
MFNARLLIAIEKSESDLFFPLFMKDSMVSDDENYVLEVGRGNYIIRLFSILIYAYIGELFP